MMSKRISGHRALAGLAVFALGSAWLSAQADQPPAPTYFTFAKNAPTIKEADITDINVLVSATESKGRQSILESYWGPNFKVPAHFHKHHAETFITLSGHVEWTIGGQTHVMGPGDAVHIPPDTIHSVKVIGGKPSQTIFISEPAGYEDINALKEALTPAQRNDKAFMKKLNAIEDYNPVNPE